MIDSVREFLVDVEQFTTQNPKELEDFRIKYLGKKGILNDLFAKFKEVPNEQKKEFGQVINLLKNQVNDKIETLKSSFETSDIQSSTIDLTRSGIIKNLGSRHPIQIVKNRIIEIFNKIGFTVADGPEIENDWHNFTALNLAEHHPARDMQDTFFINKAEKTSEDWLLRTHTSSIQIRYMENNKPPMRILAPGRVFRNEAISSRSHCIFHQIEGLYIDKNVSFADL